MNLTSWRRLASGQQCPKSALADCGVVTNIWNLSSIADEMNLSATTPEQSLNLFHKRRG